MDTMLETLLSAYAAYIEEHRDRPGYLMMPKRFYEQLQTELAMAKEISRSYLDEVTILELEQAKGFFYVKK